MHCSKKCWIVRTSLCTSTMCDDLTDVNKNIFSLHSFFPFSSQVVVIIVDGAVLLLTLRWCKWRFSHVEHAFTSPNQSHKAQYATDVMYYYDYLTDQNEKNLKNLSIHLDRTNKRHKTKIQRWYSNMFVQNPGVYT